MKVNSTSKPRVSHEIKLHEQVHVVGGWADVSMSIYSRGVECTGDAAPCVHFDDRK